MAIHKAKAKSGMSAVRQYSYDVDVVPNTYEAAQTNYTGATRDGKGCGSFHVGISNNTAGTLRIYQGWTTGQMELVDTVATQLDPVTARHTAGRVVPIVRRFVRADFIGTLGADFQQGSYFLPRAAVQFEQSGGAGGGGGGGGAANRLSFTTDSVTVTTAGTAEQGASVAIPDGFGITIKALSTNTDSLRIGTSAANAQDDAIAFALEPGDSVKLFITNLNLVWFDPDVDGEGYEYIVEQ